MQTMIRRGAFDAGHRVMHQRFKCANLHGHTYIYELHLAFADVERIGYALDFSEVKRIACAWVDERLDHAMLANPRDIEIIELCRRSGWKLYEMQLGGMDGDQNPTAENIAKEIWYAAHTLLVGPANDMLRVKEVRLWETPNCSVTATSASLTDDEWSYGRTIMQPGLIEWRRARGEVVYDARDVPGK